MLIQLLFLIYAKNSGITIISFATISRFTCSSTKESFIVHIRQGWNISLCYKSFGLDHVHPKTLTNLHVIMLLSIAPIKHFKRAVKALFMLPCTQSHIYRLLASSPDFKSCGNQIVHYNAQWKFFSCASGNFIQLP